MNIIELFEKLNLDKFKINQFSSDEIIRIEKQVNVERRLDDEIDVNVANGIIEALKKYPKEFYFIANNRNLYNFFSKKNYYRDKFFPNDNEVDSEKIKSFISQFLESDLTLFFDQKMANNRFEEIDDLLVSKNYFPDDVLFSLSKKAIGKIDFAASTLNTLSESQSINYLKQRSFYSFLSHFSSIEMDEKLKMILNFIVDIYNRNRKSEFASTSLTAMASYTPFDDDFKQTLKKNRDVVYDNENSTSSSSSSSSGYSWRTIGIGIFILIRILLAANRCSSNNLSSSNSNYEIQNNDVSDALVMETVNNIAIENKNNFYYYLTHFDNSKIEKTKIIDTIKTGQIPFEYLYTSTDTTNTNGYQKINFYNKTKYDLIVLRNKDVNRKEFFPIQSVYIKSGEWKNIVNEGVFHFYFGNRLASFNGKENERIERNSMKIAEYRFLKQPSNSDLILNKEFNFQSDVKIVEEKGKLKLLSTNLYNDNGQPDGASKNEFIFE